MELSRAARPSSSHGPNPRRTNPSPRRGVYPHVIFLASHGTARQERRARRELGLLPELGLCHLIRRGQAHRLLLLVEHDLTDDPLRLPIIVIHLGAAVHQGRVDLRPALEAALPPAPLGLVQAHREHAVLHHPNALVSLHAPRPAARDDLGVDGLSRLSRLARLAPDVQPRCRELHREVPRAEAIRQGHVHRGFGQRLRPDVLVGGAAIVHRDLLPIVRQLHRRRHHRWILFCPRSWCAWSWRCCLGRRRRGRLRRRGR
mmetsp:Transcript_3659/g.10504  ORF Transcript_3659/g.10504 Transcript_3659/m.10504 type:complete len:259 (-) Transcript_3659:534-1310(-)